MSKIKLDSTSEQNILNMLMEGSIISAEQISKINSTSAEIGKSKLETAFELNFTNEDKILKLLSSSYSLPIIDLKKTVIDPKIKKIIDARYVQDNLLVPFEMGNGILKIAIADASKLGLMKNLKTMTQMEPELYAASISDISNFVERLNKNNSQKISDKNVKVEKLEKDIDEIIISNYPTAIENIKLIKPHYYIKGKDYKNLSDDLSKNIFLEKKEVEKYKGKILFTNSELHSSSSIINKNFDFITEEAKKFFNKSIFYGLDLEFKKIINKLSGNSSAKENKSCSLLP